MQQPPNQPPQGYPPQPPYYPPPPYPQPQINVSVPRRQLSFGVRALYFIFIGWWLGILWALVALLLICTIILSPIGLVMLNMLPTVLTLYQK